MIPFLYLFIFRTLSGLQNGLGYGLRKQARSAVTIIMLIALGAAAVYFFLQHAPDWRTWLALGGILLSCVGSFAVEDNFSQKLNLFKQDIHLWELIIHLGKNIYRVPLINNLPRAAAPTSGGREACRAIF